MTSEPPSAEQGVPSESEVHDMLSRCHARLLSRVRWMMGDHARRLAESGDFMGSMIEKILAESNQLRWRDEAHFLSLATRIARNLMIDQMRRPRQQRFDSFTHELRADAMADSRAGNVSKEAMQHEATEAMLRALESLSDDHQRVIELRNFDELSFQDIGERLGRAEPAAQKLHTRALMKLGALLKR